MENRPQRNPLSTLLIIGLSVGCLVATGVVVYAWLGRPGTRPQSTAGRISRGVATTGAPAADGKVIITWRGSTIQLVDVDDVETLKSPKEGISKSTAEFICNSMGGTLVSIESEEKLAVIQNLVTSAGKSDYTYWTSAFRAAGYDNNWYWSNGVPAKAVMESKLVQFKTDNWNDEGTELTISGNGRELKAFRARWAKGFLCEWKSEAK